MAKHRGQNHFHGSTGQAQRPVRGGVANVSARDTIGVSFCWCEGKGCWINLKTGLQEWPGIENGLAHPSPALIERIEEMVNTLTRLDRSDVKQYPKRVADLLMTLVNECYIACRPIDGGQMLLYPPDGVSRPFKVIARRGENATVGFLEKQFIAKYGIHLPEKKKEEKAEVPDPTITFQSQPAKPEEYLPPQPKVEAPEFSAKSAPKPTDLPARTQVFLETEPDTVTVWRSVRHTKTNEVMPDWETNGSVFRCVLCRKKGVEWVCSERRGMAGHATGHAHERRQAEQEQAAPAPKAPATPSEAPTDDVAGALALLQEALGLPSHREAAEAADRRIAELEAEVASLREQVTTEKNRADDAVARLDLIREGLNA